MNQSPFIFGHRRQDTLFLSFVFLFLVLHTVATAQTSPIRDLAKKRLPDSILGHRTLVVPDPFNANAALRRLFPGKWYDLSTGPRDVDRLINWICPTCKTVPFTDVNGVEDPRRFPFQGGVATRLINVFSYTDSTGKQHKLMSINHSDYDPDGLQIVRFSGGLLGLAEFIRIDSGWKLETFQPAIAAFGSFSQCPTPRPLLIGDHQYAYMMVNVNGGAGGPYRQDNYLIAQVGNSYRLLLTAVNIGLTDVEAGQCSWTCSYHVVPGEKHVFRDIIIICKGRYFAADKEGLPVELKKKVKGAEQGNFTITRVYSYSAKNGYVQQLPATVLIHRSPPSAKNPGS